MAHYFAKLPTAALIWWLEKEVLLSSNSFLLHPQIKNKRKASTATFKVLKCGKIGSRLFCKAALTKELILGKLKPNYMDFKNMRATETELFLFCLDTALVQNQR